MNRFATRSLVAFVALAVAGVADAQGVSSIGSYLTWTQSPVGMPMAITSDGQAIAFVESYGGGCSGNSIQRLSTIRSDGTDYRVIVGWADMYALDPTHTKYVYQFTMSGDGRWLAFGWPENFLCSLYPPIRWYLVEVATGAMSELTYGVQPVGFVSFTDDGSLVAFKGWDPALGWGFYVADPADLSTAARFFDVSQWFSAGGQISGDGSKYVFYGSQNFICPCPAELFAYDFVTQQVTTLTPAPQPNGIAGFDVSQDGQRVVYCGGWCFGLLSDGSGAHPIPVGGVCIAISGDGTYAFGCANPGVLTRAPWEGGPVTTLQTSWGTIWDTPSSSDGTIVPGFDDVGPPPWPLAVWVEQGPVLTTYGYGVADTPLAWDVGGKAGDPFILFFGFGPASLPLKTWGTLGVDPAGLGIIAAGAIAGPDNVGHVEAQLPLDFDLLAPVPLWFQALVATSAGNRLTNTTKFTFGIPIPDPFPFDLQWSGPASGERRAAAAADPEAAWQRLRLQDPAVWKAYEQAGLELTLPSHP